MSWTTGAVSNLARKFDFLQDRAQRRPIREVAMDIQSDPSKRNTSIGHLKEFYLQRLAKAEPATAARLGGSQAGVNSGDLGQTLSGTQQVSRPTFAIGAADQDGEDLEIMCNNCFTLIRSSEAAEHGNTCFINLNRPGGGDRQANAVGVLDTKLAKLRSALEARLQDSSSKVNVMRHLTQLRYHIDTATKWVPGCSEIGALSDHTVQQVKQLTATSRVLAPAVYIFSKRIENVIVQKERQLRKGTGDGLSLPKSLGSGDGLIDTIDSNLGAASVADVSSIVSELDSDCGTQYPETIVTQDRKQSDSTTDVGNVQDANDYLSLKNEDEQRRWFYSQCLTVKLSCPDQARARRTLISDLYSKVKAENVPIENWVQWIRGQLAPEDGVASSTPASQESVPASADKAAGSPAVHGLSLATSTTASSSPAGSAAAGPAFQPSAGAAFQTPSALSARSTSASASLAASSLATSSYTAATSSYTPRPVSSDPLGPTRQVSPALMPSVGASGSTKPSMVMGAGATSMASMAAGRTLAPGQMPLRPGQAAGYPAMNSYMQPRAA